MTIRDDSYSHPQPVLVGVDGSPSSKDALAWAARYAGLVGAPLHVVTVWHMPSTLGFETPVPYEWNPESDARTILEDTVEETLGSVHRPATELSVHEGQPARVLADLAKTASAVVVGSRGRGHVAGMLLGSVSEALVSHAACPVVVVRDGSEH